MNNLKTFFARMANRQPDGVVTALGANAWRLAVDGDAATVVIGGEDGALVCHATVGSFAHVSEKGLFLEDALKANCFWNETHGATLSVDPESGDLTLADRRAADFVDDDRGLEAFFTQFFATLHGWKRHIANCSPAGAPSDEALGAPATENIILINP